METSVATVAALLALGTFAIVGATVVALRSPPPGPTATRGQRWAPLGPWLGTGVAIVLAVRGALVGAAVVALATLVHAIVARWQATRARRRPAADG